MKTKVFVRLSKFNESIILYMKRQKVKNKNDLVEIKNSRKDGNNNFMQKVFILRVKTILLA